MNTNVVAWVVFSTTLTCAVIMLTACTAQQEARSLESLVSELDAEPQSGVATESYGIIDKRGDRLVSEVRRDKEGAMHALARPEDRRHPLYVKRNLLYAMGKVGDHKGFLVAAIEEFNHGDAWLAGYACIFRLFPGIQTMHPELPSVPEVAANPERDKLPTELVIEVDKLEWNAVSATYEVRIKPR